MSLLLPIPTSTPGPTYASENNSAFTVIDSHDHTPGKGVPIPSNGININNDLPFNGFNASSLRSTQFRSQSANLSLPTDVSMLYVVNGNLTYNNQLGQPVQITAGATLNASTIGGIGGDYATSTALEFYTSADQTFTFWSNTNVPAKLDSGSITIRPQLTSPPGITINAPVSLAANYLLNLPGALPASPSYLTVDASGNMSLSKTVLPNSQTSGSSGMFSTGNTAYTPVTNLSVTITTSGNPVQLTLQSDGISGVSNMGVTGDIGSFAFFRGVTTLGQYSVNTGGSISIPASLNYVDVVSSGSHTYTVQIAISATSNVFVNNAVLIAREL